MSKHLYRGIFNWYGEVYTLFRYAASKDQAFRLFLLELVNRLGYSFHRLKLYYNRHQSNYSIQEVTNVH